MIGSLRGIVQDININNLLLDVGGVGYLVYAPVHTVAEAKLGKELFVHTYLAVRETALDLYGFATADEQRFFEMLIGISGVGPKSALSILSLADVPTLQNAIAQNNIDYLTKVSGIGKKLAQKIVLELKDKVGDVTVAGSSANQDDASVIEALEAMGYKQSEAREAVKQLPTKVKGLNARVAAALKSMSN